MSSVASTFAIPRCQDAMVVAGPGQLSLRQDGPLPHVAPDMALVRTVAVAINPADAKMLDYSPAVGAIHGCDFAGVVIALGSDTPRHLSIGDRVAGAVHRNNSWSPVSVPLHTTAELFLKIPDTMTFEETSTLGIGLATAGLALFRELEILSEINGIGAYSVPVRIEDLIDRPGRPGRPGQIRMSHRMRCGSLYLEAAPPLAPGPFNFSSWQDYGQLQLARRRISHWSSDLEPKRRLITAVRTAPKRSALTHATAWCTRDCVSESDSAQLCYGEIGRAGGRYCALEPVPQAVAAARPTVRASWLMVLTMFGGRVALDGEYVREASAADRALSAKIFAATQTLLDNGRIKSHPVRVLADSWVGVTQGVDIIRTGAISGQKLVIRVDWYACQEIQLDIMPAFSNVATCNMP
ncbi:Polyketide synthase enoylreductase [Penicillium mononematosum]|uniref:Polyketide synthase enoylreductase n=1 Tax=Penicillium mononematosum TaxID=268346 RepID=UPI0025489B4E|nr:Polyketide synthase enoylreductase [Penicillium mononematosum]KAJ6188189.1 Polyketide synthase enoylreductase [Penicillium mononematosum]